MSQLTNSDSETLNKLATLESENKKLREKIEQIERQQTEFLQNISHQLVAPLNAMKWHIENITEVRISVERARKVLRSIYSQATIAVHLAQNFNLMSNLETDHALSTLQEPLKAVPLQELMVNLADDFQPLAWDKDINIIVDKSHFDIDPPILVFKPLIQQVFSNIIENAVKYSNPGTNILIDGKYVRETDSFRVSIRNQGIPLPKDSEVEIFTRAFITSKT